MGGRGSEERRGGAESARRARESEEREWHGRFTL